MTLSARKRLTMQLFFDPLGINSLVIFDPYGLECALFVVNGIQGRNGLRRKGDRG